MGFVDGENLTIRGQEIAKSVGINLTEGPLFRKDQFLWIPNLHALQRYGFEQPKRLDHAERVTYYANVWGDDVKLAEIRDALWRLHFSPQVFKKTRKDEKAKGVDIALTRDMLVHAFFDHYDTAVLYSADADYIPVIEEVKRLGRRVILHSFKEAVTPPLLHAVDAFFDLTDLFVNGWTKGLPPVGLR
jgi:uncharacterized LabA/DUF88 family protein